ncbi:MAG: DUF4114 domain-containing protein, partial [Sandaracinaceae bacterium]|nr:DUF4114 domain-containing protein [Sandaracinaceae bacterium]
MRLLCFALAVLPSLAHADIVTQPTGERVPSEPGCRDNRPTGLLATFACICEDPGVCNIGGVCPSETSCPDGRNSTCESRMYHVFNDNTCIPSQHDGLDPREDASVEPQRFSPTCALTFTVESRGTALFGNAFGWYNVPAGGGPPDPSDLHLMLGCDAAPGASVVLDVRSEPAYRGGEIGFFLLTPESHTARGTCAGGDCCATLDRYGRGEGYVYYSQRDLNPDHRGASSFIHLLVYDSVISERKFYFAWEDTYDSSNDDFTDLVTSVSGVECAGAGAACDTGMTGACGRGVTRCQDGTLSCAPRYTAQAEVCDGLDEDCDGIIDDGAPCPEGQVCDNGACVPHCQFAVEFQCLGVQTDCDTASGYCVEPACREVTCPPGPVCRGGECRGECDGVVCPHGTQCFRDTCIDPCDGVTCASGQICRGGLCVPGCGQCDGVLCTAGQLCDPSGECRHPDCPASCPAGQHCEGPGGCRDSCEGAICPRGEVCRAGRCEAVEVPDGGPPPGTDGGASAMRDGGTSGPPRG